MHKIINNVLQLYRQIIIINTVFENISRNKCVVFDL